MQVESLADWDREPVREILTALLVKSPAELLALAWIEPELDAMAASGLLEHRLATPTELEATLLRCPVPGASVWVLSSTVAGQVIGLHLAYSGDLLGALILSGRVLGSGQPWTGASPDSIVAELDRRAGGSGRVPDVMGWFSAREIQDVEALPRRFDLDLRSDGGVHAS